MGTNDTSGNRLDDAAIERLGEQIVADAVELDTTMHRFLARIRTFDEQEGWGRQGALSCAHWLAWRVGLDLVTARAQVRVARALGGLRLIDEAFRAGQLSYSKVRAMTRVATPENEARLLEFGLASTGSQMERICRRLRGVMRSGAGASKAAAPERYVRHYATDDGMLRIQAQLHPDEGALVLEAIEAARRGRAPVDSAESGANGAGDDSAESERDPGRGAPAEPAQDGGTGDRASTPAAPGPDDSAESRRPAVGPWRCAADALVEIAESFLAGGHAEGPRRPRFEVTVVVDRATLQGASEAPAALGRDLAVPAETARRLACDAALVEAAVDAQGEVTGVGRRTRTVPLALRRALELRDGGCRFPCCTNQLFVDGHHIRHWAQGGPTTLANTTLLCRSHHRLVHEGGFRVVMEEGCPVFLQPDGRRLDDVPSRPGVVPRAAPDPSLAVRPPPPWDGNPPDYRVAIEALLECWDRESAA